ncbi:FUSC family protein [Nocardia veterana]|uniref:FUSC family protein n=1 Tax=Nocardia veterana TaxID=132249 RepID=UPI00030F8EF0|nr:FUSC family protein [Nocardia veterana]
MRISDIRVRSLVRRGLAGLDHLPAARVFVGLAIPGLSLIALGRTDLLIYAVFGSFTGMYGFAESARQRLTHQLEAAAVLITGTGAGILLAYLQAPAWLLVVAVAAFAGVAAPITDRLGLRPEGPFFGIFAFGAIAMVADSVADPLVSLAVCAATAGGCVVVGYCDAIRHPAPGVPTSGRRGRGAAVQAVRYVVAIAIAGGSGLFLGIGHANWAMAGAAVPLVAATARGQVRRGVHRVVGTCAGLALTAPLLLPALDPAVPALAIIALLYPTELFMARHYAVALGFFTPLIMAMTELAAPTDPVAMLRDRAIDTVLGVSVGVAVALLIRDPAAVDAESQSMPGRTACSADATADVRSPAPGLVVE